MAKTPHRSRILAALILAIPAFVAIFMASQIIPSIMFGEPIDGTVMPVVGMIQFVGGLAVLALLLKLAQLDWKSIGWSLEGWRLEALIGLAVAVFFAALQFGLVIPLTGGAERSDVIANLRQIGEGPIAIAGMLLFQTMGPAAEEFYFRGLLLNGLFLLAGGGRFATVLAILTTTILFALSHGYQGVAGMIDTGLYGGLTLSLLYVWRRTLVAPIVAHAGWNILAVIGLYLFY